MNNTFIHHRVYSSFSLLEGMISVHHMACLCRQHHMPAMALTDTNNLFGACAFSQACEKQGIQPILGCTLSLKVEMHHQKEVKSQLPVIVRTCQGYHNLIHLLAAAYKQNPSCPTTTWDALDGHTDGLAALTGGPDGPINPYTLTHHKKAQEHLEHLCRLFPDALYVELIRQGAPEQQEIESQLLHWAFQKGLPLLATNPTFFEKPQAQEAHDALLCIASGTYVHETQRRCSNSEYRFKSPQEMIQLFQDIPEAAANTITLAERCSYYVKASKPIMPAFATSEGDTERDTLKRFAQLGLHQRAVPQNKTKNYQNRLDYELNMIIKMGFAGYFLIVADFVQWAKKNNIPVGPGRGSGAGSLVAWALTITEVDPIEHQLIFERFLNPERVSLPDFDIDFCQNRRDEVIQYVQKKYGHDHVAQITTFGTLQPRAALRDVGRVLQMPYGQVDRLAKQVPFNPAKPLSLAQAVAQELGLQTEQKEDPTVKKLFDISIKVEGLYRHASTHAAGIVISRDPLETLMPLYYDPHSTLPITQFNMHDVEYIGLLKFDFLGLKTLTVLDHAIKLLKQQGQSLCLSQIPLDDELTFKYLHKVHTFGIFQLESSGMQEVLRQLQPTHFKELVALVALFRPGPMDDIPRYLKCKHGQEPVTYLHPMMEDILRETFGVIVYQEQVMHIAQKLAGYTLTEADLLRRAMGKKIRKEMEAQRNIFVKGTQKKKISETLAHKIFDAMAKFAGYGFNRCHSTPYALLSYQTAYLKAHYPALFLAASLTLDRHNTDKIARYHHELIRHNISFLPPDINKADVFFSVKTHQEKPAIRYALSAIKNVGEGAMQAIVTERNTNGPFTSIHTFMERTAHIHLNKRHMEHLIYAGAFDELEPNRHRLIDHIDALLKTKQASGSCRQGALFKQADAFTWRTVPLWSPAEQSQKERETLGFFLSHHPLENYQAALKNSELTALNQLIHTLQNPPDAQDQTARKKEKQLIMAAVVEVIQDKTSKTGNRYAFLQLSDLTGSFEASLFGSAFQDYRGKILPGSVLLLTVRGHLAHNSVPRLTIVAVDNLEAQMQQPLRFFTVRCGTKQAILHLKEHLNNVTKDSDGAAVRILYTTEHGHVVICLEGRYKLTNRDFYQLKHEPIFEHVDCDPYEPYKKRSSDDP